MKKYLNLDMLMMVAGCLAVILMLGLINDLFGLGWVITVILIALLCLSENDRQMRVEAERRQKGDMLALRENYKSLNEKYRASVDMEEVLRSKISDLRPAIIEDEDRMTQEEFDREVRLSWPNEEKS